MKRLIIAMPFIITMLLVILFAHRLITPQSSGWGPSPLIGKPIPLEIAEIKGPYVVNFFASWCAPCEIEHPIFMKMKEDGLKIIGIAYKDSHENIENFLKKKGNPYQKVLYDDNGFMGISMGITGVPESFLIDDDAIVRNRQPGPFDRLETLNTFLKGEHL